MLRVILALLSVTATASAAMPFEVPMVAIPTPAIYEPGPIHYRPSNVAPRSFTYPSVMTYCAGGLIEIGPQPHAVMGLIELFGSEARYRSALESTRVDVVRLTPRFTNSDRPKDYTEGEALALHGRQWEIIPRALTADSSYDWEPVADLFYSPPVYDLRIRLHQGNKMLTADLSLSARTICIHENHAIIAEQPLSERGFGLLLFLDRPQR